MSVKKKIGLFSAIFLSLASMMGAGIFIKVRSLNTLAHNHTAPIVVLFLFFLVIVLSFMYVFSKIISSQTGDMGFMEWSKKFCNPSLHLSFCRFVRHLYYPASLFLFSVYGVIGITGEQLGIFSTLILAFLILVFFVAINFISFKWAKILQTILFCIVLIPVLSLPIIAMKQPGNPSDSAAPQTLTDSFWRARSEGSTATGLDGLGPWLSLISGMPSLFFIYDGFYNISSLKSRLRNPQYLKFIVVISMSLITLIYLFVIVGFNIGDPENSDFRNFMILRGKHMSIDFFELSISCAGFLTLNSIIMSGMPQIYAMHESHKFEGELKVRRFLFYKKHHLNVIWEKKFSIIFIVLCKTFLCFLISGLVLFLSYRYGLQNKPIEIIDSLADIVTIFVFLILVAIIIGSFKVEAKKIKNDKLFTKCAKLCVTSIISSLLYLFISYVVGLTGYFHSNIFFSFIKLSILFIFFLVCFSEQIYFFLMRKFKKRWFQLYPKYPEDSRITLK